MMIKIGECILNEEKILSFDTLAEPEEGVQVVMEGGHTLDLFDVSMPDVEHALIEAGLLAALPEPVESVFSIEELAELSEMLDAGFNFVAKDQNGQVFAYKNLPLRSDRQWIDTGDDTPVELSHRYYGLGFVDDPLDLGSLDYSALEG